MSDLSVEFDVPMEQATFVRSLAVLEWASDALVVKVAVYGTDWRPAELI